MQVEEKPAEKAQRSLRFEDPAQKVPYLCIRPLEQEEETEGDLRERGGRGEAEPGGRERFGHSLPSARDQFSNRSLQLHLSLHLLLLLTRSHSHSCSLRPAPLTTVR